MKYGYISGTGGYKTVNEKSQRLVWWLITGPVTTSTHSTGSTGQQNKRLKVFKEGMDKFYG